MRPVFIGIAGGTASGKTTYAKLIYENASKHGTVIYIKMDDYYKSLDGMTFEERTSVNYDHPDAFDSALLVEHLQALKKGKSVEMPIYDFVVHNRKQETRHVDAAPVVIIEGIMTLAIPEIRQELDLKIYVDTDDDIRFIRRLKRDMRERGRSVESVINQYLTTVRPMHLTFIEPSKKFADIIIPEGGKNEVAVDILSTKIIDLINKQN